MKLDKSLLSGSTTLLVLSLLRSGDKYGYQMIQDLAVLSNQTFMLKEGTLYPVLHALEKEGSLKSYVKQSPTGKDRKYYTITKSGMRLLTEKTENWNIFAGAVNQVLQAAI
ncbi:MAG: helix-turn-helix transcriptional regulator [Oscillospiraceae bacterium]|nr:helix-turn-helix transcriptional regulator [Oscillospiraceae bacterium]